MSKLIPNTKGWKIRSVEGYESFEGIADMGCKRIYEVSFTDKTSVKITKNHRLMSDNLDPIKTIDLRKGDVILSDKCGISKVVDRVERTEEKVTVYDIIESRSNMFFFNGVLSHNCEFLSEDHTLIDTMIINNIENEMDKQYESNGGEPPLAFKVGDLEFFKKINKSLAYIVTVDVASGNGNDYSVIQVTEFPTLEQVLEFRSNTTSEKFLYSRLKNILLFLQQNSKEVYFSVENNGLGASILALYEYDESPPHSAFLISDPGSKRLGLSMSDSTKRSAGMKLKHMIESRIYRFYSRHLLKELKSYTRQGANFKAEAGSTDDAIAALLILMRVLEEMADFNPYAYEKVYNAKGYDNQQDEWDESFSDDPDSLDNAPMPIMFG